MILSSEEWARAKQEQRKMTKVIQSAYKEAAKERSKRQRLSPGVSSMRGLYRSYRRRANGRPFTLTLEQFDQIVTQECIYCGETLTRSYRTNKRSSPYICTGLTLKVKKAGYTVENCIPCCKVCSRAKRGRPHNDFSAWIHRVHWRLQFGND